MRKIRDKFPHLHGFDPEGLIASLLIARQMGTVCSLGVVRGRSRLMTCGWSLPAVKKTPLSP